MDIQQILEGLDHLFEKKESDKVEEYLSTNLEQALKESDIGSAITLINELIGFYRDTSQYDKAEAYCGKLLPFMERAGLKDTIHYGTSCLNIANAYRASGRFADSLVHYQKVFEIYEKLLEKTDFRYASLYNNLSLLYQEEMQFDKASEALLKALEIVTLYREAVVERAVTYTNLAASYVKNGELDKAKKASACGLAIFEDGRKEDYHYSAALSVAGDIHFASKEYEQAAAYYEQAMLSLREHVGITHAWFRIVSNLKMAFEYMGKPEALKGMVIARDYYGEYGKKFRELATEKISALKDMQTEVVSHILSEMTFAKVGEGSESFGLDDILSKDHDFGPGFCVFVTRNQFELYGKQLEEAYVSLPDHFRGFSRPAQITGALRNGIIVIEDFYSRILCMSQEETEYLMENHTLPPEVWLRVQDWQLKTVTNGEIFDGKDTVFAKIYHNLKKGYPQMVWRRRLANVLGFICQEGQYNYQRLMQRRDMFGAVRILHSFEDHVIEFLYLFNRVYMPHIKWMMQEAASLKKGQDILELVKSLMMVLPDTAVYQKRAPVDWIGKENPDDIILQKIHHIAERIVELLKNENLTESSDWYLESHISYILREGKRHE